MDGNGRWAERRGLPRVAGHREGIEAVRRVVEAAPDLGVGMLTLFAFSSDNWRRPPAEVERPDGPAAAYLRRERAPPRRERRAAQRDRPARPAAGRARATKSTTAERATAHGTRLHLNVALDYSARDAIANAASAWLGDDSPARAAFGRLLAMQGHGPGRDVDLLIRTGGEKRLSDFLLWECAYAELHFTDAMWPDFGAEHLRAAIADFHARERRFGGLLVAAE